MATDVNENKALNEESNSELSRRNENEKDTDWKRRTLELEEQLYVLRERVNSQTGKIREAVSKRLKTAEDNTKLAEEKAENLLKKMKELEERTLVAESKVTRCYERNQHLEDIIEQKESIIRQLRMTISEQNKNEIDARLFEEKVAKVKEWVKQCKLTIEDLQLQIQEKEDMIERLKNGYSQHNGVRHFSRMHSADDIEGRNGAKNITRARSKSAVTLSRGVVKVSEIVPAVPPRRASLGILSRTNSVLNKSPAKCSLKAWKESTNSSSEVELKSVEGNELNKKLSESEENLENERTYMVLEPDPDVEYAVPNKSKFFLSAEKEGEDKPPVRMTMRERLKQLTQSSEDEIDHNDDSDMSPAKEKQKSELVNELMNSLDVPTHEDESSQSVVGQQQVVTVKFSAEGGMLSAEGAKVTTSAGGRALGDGDKECANDANHVPRAVKEPRFKLKPGTDAQGYTKLLHVDKRNSVNGEKGNEKSGSSFVSYLPPESSPNKVDSDSSGCSSQAHTPPVSRSWVQDHRVLNPVINGVIASEEWKRASDVDIINGTQDGFACHLTQIQSCPVYAQLEGRASEIQSRPCTGDSTDSSDNEGDTSSGFESESPSVGRAKSVSVSDRLLRRGSAKRKVLKTCAQYTTHNLKSESLQKTGYLSKLGGRIKNWKRRWFVLSENKLSYFKTENDVNKKALGQIPLDGFCGITRTEGSLSFQIETAKRTYYLTGESIEDIDDWLKVLQNVLRKFMASPLLAQVNEKAVMKGWITKVKLGKSKRVYCILRGKYLCYYKGESDPAPFGLVNVKEVCIEKIIGVDSEDELDVDESEHRTGRFTLRLYDEKQPSISSVYLVVDNKQDLNAWLYHLTMASGNINQVSTQFERTIAKLKEEDSDTVESKLWNSDIITHSKDPLEHPLTTLPSDELESKALQLFKSIQLFCDTECVPGPAIEYHVVYAQNALQTCMTHVELREEMFCQLMKQTAKRMHVLSESASALERFLAPHSEWLTTSRSASVSSDATIDLRPIREYVYEQCWQLLILCCTLFIPRGLVLWFLKAHLERYSSKQTIIGKYAKYCQQCLERTLQNGEREACPSRMEVIAVLLDDPFEKRHPLKIPVHFVNRTSEEFGFDAATTVQELIDAINSEIGLRSIEQNGYALYTDNPVGPVQHCLQTSVKVCDVISKWEKAMHSSQPGRHETNRMIRLSYKNRLYFASLSKNETPTERYFLVYQTFNDIVHGRFPMAKDRCIRMAALMAQMEFGDRVAQDNQGEDRVSMIQERFYPRKLNDSVTSDQRRQLRNRFLDGWQSLMGKTKQECITLYLRMAKSWTSFGAKLFKAKQRRIVSRKRDSASENLEDVWLAVAEECISILDVSKMNPVFKYKYRSVVTFGGWKEDFMLVVNKTTPKVSGQSEHGTERLLFVMPRAKILEITLLIASYINAIVRQQGLTFDVTCTTKKTSGAAEKNIKVWDMESDEWPMVPGAGLI